MAFKWIISIPLTCTFIYLILHCIHISLQTLKYALSINNISDTVPPTGQPPPPQSPTKAWGGKTLTDATFQLYLWAVNSKANL